MNLHNSYLGPESSVFIPTQILTRTCAGRFLLPLLLLFPPLQHTETVYSVSARRPDSGETRSICSSSLQSNCRYTSGVRSDRSCPNPPGVIFSMTRPSSVRKQARPSCSLTDLLKMENWQLEYSHLSAPHFALMESEWVTRTPQSFMEFHKLDQLGLKKKKVEIGRRFPTILLLILFTFRTSGPICSRYINNQFRKLRSTLSQIQFPVVNFEVHASF